MPFAKNLLAGSGSRFPLVRMLRKGVETSRGGIPGEGGVRSRAAGLRTPEAALSLENISTGVSRRRTGLYQWYNEQLAQRPIATKAWTCFVGERVTYFGHHVSVLNLSLSVMIGGALGLL
jgi:hypothetical protein